MTRTTDNIFAKSWMLRPQDVFRLLLVVCTRLHLQVNGIFGEFEILDFWHSSVGKPGRGSWYDIDNAQSPQ